MNKTRGHGTKIRHEATEITEKLCRNRNSVPSVSPW